jgi:hypothetical protein
MAAVTVPVALFRATTCAGKMPVTPAGEIGRARGFAGRTRPPIAPKGMTTEELGDAMLQTVRQMSPDAKAHVRAKLRAEFGIPLPVLLWKN